MPAASPASPQTPAPACHQGNRLTAWWHENQWTVIGLLSLLALGMGMVGFRKLAEDPNEPRTWADALYLTLQLFTLESGSVAGAKSWELQVARFLAPGLFGYATFTAVLALFRDEIQRFKLRSWKNHVVICGFGEKGQRLASDCLARGDRVVIVEAAEERDTLGHYREQGAIVLKGNATSPFLLCKARVPSAKHLFAVTGDDGVNVEIAVQAQKIALANSSCRPVQVNMPARQWCFVHLLNTELRTMLERTENLTGCRGPCQARFFDIYENAARLVFRDHPPDYYARLQGTDQVHLLIIGFGRLGESLALQAAQQGHYASGLKVKVTIVDAEADRKVRQFCLRYPKFPEIFDVTFHTLRLEDPEFFELRFLTDGAVAKSPTMAFICLENEHMGFLGALHLQKSFGSSPYPILVRVRETAGLASLLPAAGDQTTSGGGLYPFGGISQTCNLKLILDETLDAMAKQFHVLYVRELELQGYTRKEKPAMAPWGELAEDLKNSNRQAAEHLWVKVRTLRCRTRPKKPGEAASFDFSPEEIELLARMEHNRWNAERWLAGWTLCDAGIDEDKMKAKKLSPHLISYEELTEKIKKYDRQSVKNIPVILDMLGLLMVRSEA